MLSPALICHATITREVGGLLKVTPDDHSQAHWLLLLLFLEASSCCLYVSLYEVPVYIPCSSIFWVVCLFLIDLQKFFYILWTQSFCLTHCQWFLLGYHLSSVSNRFMRSGKSTFSFMASEFLPCSQDASCKYRYGCKFLIFSADTITIKTQFNKCLEP